MKSIQMVDLKSQYQRIKPQIDQTIQECLDETSFIKGSQVFDFQKKLANYLNSNYVVACGNGTDALQLAMMALRLKPGDEVIVPAFTYIATVEVIALLGLTPVIVDVDYNTFNLTHQLIEPAISSKTRLIVPVHLFGQCSDMENIMNFASKNNLFVVEDTAQALGADFKFTDGTIKKAGTIGNIGCTSFFPSKNLGCYGDGGATYTDDSDLAIRLNMIANHGQVQKYLHEIIGVNSRLDTIQAAILNQKLTYLNEYNQARQKAAAFYDIHLSGIESIEVPYKNPSSSHVYHQYTIKVTNQKRDSLKDYLAQHNIPSMVYYPIPMHKQPAYANLGRIVGDLTTSNQLCKEVLSLPMHTELDEEQQYFIVDKIKIFFS